MNTKAQRKGDKASPKLAQCILTLFLPATIRESILGDLEEEALDLMHHQNKRQVHLWYWRQVFLTSCIYGFKQRGSTMAYFFGLLFFIVIQAVTMLMTANDVSLFFNGPSFIVVVPLAIVLGITSTSVSSSKLALRLVFIDEQSWEEKEVRSACRFLRVAGNQFILLGLIGLIMGTVAIAESAELALAKGWMGQAIAVCFLTLLYALLGKSLFYSAEQKLINKYLVTE